MVAIKASWPLRPPSTRAILAAFPSAQPSSGRWLRWLCPSHPPGRMMAVIQPSQPSAGGWLSRIRPSLLAAPDTSAGGSTHAARATTPLFWMAGVVISQPCVGVRNARVAPACSLEGAAGVSRLGSYKDVRHKKQSASRAQKQHRKQPRVTQSREETHVRQRVTRDTSKVPKGHHRE